MPDIVLLDADYRERVDPEIRISWSVVQSFIEITAQEHRSYSEHKRSVLTKASNIFHAQIHRQFVIAIVIWGKLPNLHYICFFVDRAGGVSSQSMDMQGHGALAFARLIVGMRYGGDELLGHDLKITINRLTGLPLSVFVGAQEFFFVTEIFNSPFLFGRGTKVFIVKDKHDVHFILKDSWILTVYNISEVNNLQKINEAAREVGTDPRLQALLPKLIVGDNDVANTSVLRGILPSDPEGSIRQRRRFVTGPIGDPITTYCSRVECIQAFIDIADRKYSTLSYIYCLLIAKRSIELKFLDDKCNLVHGDISVNNVVIVRKLPNIITTLPPLSLSSRITSPTDGTQSKALPSMSSTALNPASSVLESSTASAISEQPLRFLSSAPDPTSSAPKPNPASSSMVVDTIGDEERSFWENPSMKSYGKNGLAYDVQSGGSIIDFDCSHDATEDQSVLTRSVRLNFLYSIYYMLTNYA